MKRFGKAFVLFIPLILVNSAALYGQTWWAFDHMGRNWFLAVTFSAALESVGIYLAYQAHESLMAGDSAIRLRFGSYVVAAGVGALNYAHYSPAWDHPDTRGVAFGALSTISPWLWTIRSRSLNRDRLRELDEIDPRAVKFPAVQWLLYPVRTMRAFRRAVWMTVTEPARARALVDGPRVRVTDWSVAELVDVDQAVPVSPAPAGGALELATDEYPVVVPAGRMSLEDRTEQVRRLLDKNPGITQDRLAEMVGLSTRRLRDIMKGIG